jgi:hypothetical protein
MPHHQIRPVERDCICPARPATVHTANCEAAFREKFFSSWRRERDRFNAGGPLARGERREG